MRVLLADKLASHVPTLLEDQGHEIQIEPSLKDESLEAAISSFNPEVLVVRSTKVKANHLQSCDSLSLVIRAGAGVNTIDLSTASRLGL